MNLQIRHYLLVISVGAFLSLTVTAIQPVLALVSNETTINETEAGVEPAQFQTYEDEEFGFTIRHPSDWKPDTSDNAYNAVVSFTPPENDAATDVRVFPRGEGETLRSYGNDLKEDPNFRISEYYRNSTTKLGGLPAIFTSGSYFNTVNQFEEALGYQSSTSRTYQVWALNEDRDEFYAVIFHGDQSNYDKYVPIVKSMVESFQFTENAPIIQEED